MEMAVHSRHSSHLSLHSSGHEVFTNCFYPSSFQLPPILCLSTSLLFHFRHPLRISKYLDEEVVSKEEVCLMTMTSLEIAPPPPLIVPPSDGLPLSRTSTTKTRILSHRREGSVRILDKPTDWMKEAANFVAEYNQRSYGYDLLWIRSYGNLHRSQCMMRGYELFVCLYKEGKGRIWTLNGRDESQEETEDWCVLISN